MSGLLAFLVKIGFRGMVDRALEHLETRAKLENEREALKTKTTVELAKLAVNEVAILKEYEQKKLSFPWFWLFAALFIVPLAMWWTAVIIDSVFMFSWNVADLPTPQMQEWAGRMIQWLFFVGSGVAGLRALRG